MFYLFDLTKNGKNYGTISDAQSNQIINPNRQNHYNGEQHDNNAENDQTVDCVVETPLHSNRKGKVSSEEDPLRLPALRLETLSIDNAVDRLGLGRFHYQLLISCGLLLAADSIQRVLLTILSKSQMESLEFTTTTDDAIRWASEESTKKLTEISMVVFPGVLMGALVLGMLGDMLGRRPVFCFLTAPIIALFGLGTAVVSASATLSNQWLLLTSFMVAFGVGGLTIPFDTFSEWLSLPQRGRYLICLQIFGIMGTLMVHLILDFLLLHNNENGENNERHSLYVMVPQLHATAEDEIAFSASWQWVVLVVICAIPCIFATVLGILTVPESPRWLVAKGYNDQALIILRRVASINGHDGWKTFPAGTILFSHGQLESLSSICNLCSPDWMKVTSSLWAIYFGLSFLDHGTMTLTVSVFYNDERQQNYQALFRSCSELAGLVVALFSIDRWGRIPTQRWSYLGGGISCLIISPLISPINDDNDNLLLVLAFIARMLVTSGTAATWISTCEVLATEIRASRHALANAVGHIGGFVAKNVFLQINSLPTTGLVLFAMSLWTALACGGLPETCAKEMGLARRP